MSSSPPSRTAAIVDAPPDLAAWVNWFAGAEIPVLRDTADSLEAAYPLRFLRETWRHDVPDREAQLAFLQRWPGPTERTT